MDLTAISINVFDNCTRFAHLFAPEVSEPDRFTLQTVVGWDQIETTIGKVMVRDWRGRCFQKVSFLKMSNVPALYLAEVGVHF